MKARYYLISLFTLPFNSQAENVNVLAEGELYKVCFFEHSAYLGRSRCHTGTEAEPSFEIADLALEDFNDTISSISITGNASVKFWKDSNFSGEKYGTLMNVYRLGKLNDKISSYSIHPGPTILVHDRFSGQLISKPASFACLFQDAGFEGTPMCLAQHDFGSSSIYSLSQYNYNDEASSLKIEQRNIYTTLRVILYEDALLTGKTHPTYFSINNMKDIGFNDKTSSIEIITIE